MYRLCPSARASETRVFASRRTACGASSVLVIMVLVLFSGLSVYVTGLVSSVSNGYAMEMNLMRASQAAESGLEWGRYMMMQNNAACVAQQNITMPGSLEPYTVTVRCTAGGAELAGPPASFVQYRLNVNACNIPSGGSCPNSSPMPGSDYVERQLTGWVDR